MMVLMLFALLACATLQSKSGGSVGAQPLPSQPMAAPGGSYYVAPNGSDNNPGTLTQPFKTLQRAVPRLRPGETLIVRAGEYDTGLGLSGGLSHGGASIIPSGTSWDNPVTIKAYPGERPVFRRYLPPGHPHSEEEVRNSVHLSTYEECARFASYGLVKDFPHSCWQGSGNNQPAGGLFWQAPKGFVPHYVLDFYNIRVPVRFLIIDGIDLDAKGIVPNPVGLSDFADHIRFQNLEIRYGIGSCITQWAKKSNRDFDLQFIRTKIHSCGVPFDTNKVNGVLARKNGHARFWHGWYLHAGGARFIDSESYNHAGTGLSPDGNNIVVRNSYIHDNAVQGIYISGGDNWTIENNVFSNNGAYQIHNVRGKGHSIRNNTIVAGPRNDFTKTGVNSYGIFLQSSSGDSVHESNIVDGFRYGIYNQSTGATPNVVRNNLIRSKPAGSEIYNEHGSKPPLTSGNLLK